MDRIECFLCSEMFVITRQSFNDDKKKMSDHFKEKHFLRLSDRYESIICGSQNCDKQFVHFSTYYSHVFAKHLSFSSDDTKNVYSERIDFSGKFAKMMAEIRLSNASSSASDISRFSFAANDLLLSCMEDVGEVVKKFMVKKNIDLNAADTRQFLSVFSVENNLKIYQTIDGQVKSIKRQCTYVDPVECQLHKVGKIKKDSKTSELKPTETFRTFQYIPIIETLKLVLSNKEVMDFVQNEKDCSHADKYDDCICTYRTCKSFKNHEFLQKFSKAIRIKFYFDEFLPNNPLGAKTHGNKIAAFYCSFQNLPNHLKNFIGNVHTVLLAYNCDVEKYGFYNILEPFVADLKRLESDQGVECKINNQNFVLRATLVAFCGDTLAANALLGFLGPGANRFCRLCTICRNDLYTRSFCKNKERTVEQHEACLASIHNAKTQTESDNLRTASGIKTHCILNESKHFHCTQNFVMDILHDFLEGQFMYGLKLVIAKFILDDRYKIDLDEFHSRLLNFPYGPIDAKNKPSLTFTLSNLKKVHEHKIQQSASQVRCLIRVLPFIIADKINENDMYLRFLLNMGKILQIVFAPKITRSIIFILESLIIDHDKEFREAFPDADIINKLHHLFHYVTCTIMSGPSEEYNCFIFEARHKFLRAIARNCNNYINLISTIAKISQMSQAAVWGKKKNVVRQKFWYTTAHEVTIENLENGPIVSSKDFRKSAVVKKTYHLKIFSYEYNVGSFVVINSGTGSGNQMPLFGKIVEIFIYEDNAYIVIEEWQSDSLDEPLNAYRIRSRQQLAVVKVDDLCDSKSIDAWKSYRDNDLFIALHHLIF